MSYCCVNKHTKFYAEFKIQVEERWRLIFEITDHIITTGPGDNIMMTRSVWMNKEFCSAGFGPSFDNGGEVNQVTFGSFPGIIVSSNRCVLACTPDIKSFLYEAIAASPPLLVCDRSFGTWGWNRSLEIEAGQLWIFCSYPGKYTRFIARFIKINNYLLFNAESLIEHLHGLQPGSKVHNFAGASQ